MTDTSAADTLRNKVIFYNPFPGTLVTYTYFTYSGLLTKHPKSNCLVNISIFFQYQGISINIVLFEKFRILLQMSQNSASFIEFLSG